MAQSQYEPVTGIPPRVYYLDNFRTYLTSVVIYHHATIPYGGVGSWMYKSRFHAPESSLPLMAFNGINQSYFMGSFFFLSGHFSSRALERKGPTSFLGTKFFKLGLPTLAFTAFGEPLMRTLISLYKNQPLGWDILLKHWKLTRGVKGPVWYLALVLIFDTLHTCVPSISTYTAKCQFLPIFLLDVAANFLIRLKYPVGTTFKPLNLQPAYASQYVLAYFLRASRSSPPTPPLTPTSRNVILASSILSAVTAGSLLYLYPNIYTMDSFRGGANLVALSYAILNESTGYLLGSALLELFRKRRELSRSWGSVGRYSYAAFLVHPIVLVSAQTLSDDWKASGVLKTVVVGTVGVLGSWGVGWALVKIPGVDRVLT
jgi:fucose 4-O-acetylase-like acetyltransferase